MAGTMAKVGLPKANALQPLRLASPTDLMVRGIRVFPNLESGREHRRKYL